MDSLAAVQRSQPFTAKQTVAPGGKVAWLVICRDIDDSASLRREHLDRHLAYIDTVMDEVAVAGPYADSPGGDFVGSCFIYRTDDRAVAESLLRNDPYFEAGLYREVTFHALRIAAGTWVGGDAWRSWAAERARK